VAMTDQEKNGGGRQVRRKGEGEEVTNIGRGLWDCNKQKKKRSREEGRNGVT